MHFKTIRGVAWNSLKTRRIHAPRRNKKGPHCGPFCADNIIKA
jgi:hypothetical protein